MNPLQFNQNIFPLEGQVQHYDWGGHDFLPLLLRMPNPDRKAFAEYWMGAHTKAPALLTLPDGTTIPLDAFIRQSPDRVLGAAVTRRFGRLPYLFKVLDVKDMLSIQVHPSLEAARREFAAEEARGIPADAATRNYKDDNHKPELMLALGPFWLLHGFKPADALRAVLEATPELGFLLPAFEGNDYQRLYRTVMEMDQEEVNRALAPLIDRIVPAYEADQLDRSKEDFWAARAVKTFCRPGHTDRGIFSIYLFNLVHLKRGEAIFQDAGILHAYLEGQNMELMANSDNVLRGGLTPKHVDVPELMKHVRFAPIEPEVITGMELVGTSEEIFASPAADFELHRLCLSAGESTELTIRTADIFFVYEGQLEVLSGSNRLERRQGEAFLAIPGEPIRIRAASESLIFHATVPHPQA